MTTCTASFLKDLFKLEEIPDIRDDDKTKFVINRALKGVLSEREIETLSVRYGLQSGEILSKEATAEKLGVSIGSIPNMVSKAFVRLRKATVTCESLHALIDGAMYQAALDSLDPQKLSIYDFRLMPSIYKLLEEKGCKTLADVREKFGFYVDKRDADELNRALDAFYPREECLDRGDKSPEYSYMMYAISGGCRDSFVSRSMRPLFLDAFAVLTERGEVVMKLRYGLMGGGRLTLEEVGWLIGASRERVRILEAKSIRRLKQCIFCKMDENWALMSLCQYSYLDLAREVLSLRKEKERLSRLLLSVSKDSDVWTQIDKANLTDLDELNLSVRTYNVLKRAGFNTVGDVLTKSDKSSCAFAT